MPEACAGEVFAVEGVSFSYDGHPALKDVSFTVEAGESLSILGANGTGKTTLLKVLDGLAAPDTGSVRFFGSPLTDRSLTGDLLRAFRSRVGLVFSDPDVQLFSPTVFDEVAFGPLQLGLGPGEAARRADELLDMLGISRLRDRPPYALSDGEKKKVAIASVLAADPDVLLLDEPTGGLDPRSQVWFMELLAELRTLDKTFVISTHDLSLAEDFSDRIIVLSEGHGVAADGPKAEILADRALLLEENIIHEHAHRHGDVVHVHSHGPFSVHDEHD
ncbi:MAG: energy-coupling factor ABC transporter ATP-binding protein [Thermodesulfobacteriota bacterium]